MTARILVVDDKVNMRSLLNATLADLGEVVLAEGGRRAFELLRASPFDVVVSDIKMPDLDGHALLHEAQSLPHPPEVILMTAFGTLESAVAALREHAFDYVTKPFDPDVLKATVVRALEKRGVAPSQRALQGFRGIVGASPAMRDLFERIVKVAASDAGVLIVGESGTGKDLVARAIHDAGPRADRPFVAVSSAAIPAASMEAELFGTTNDGTGVQRAGLFEEAHGGTLYLDEIGEMRRALQAKLTRALAAKAVRRVGDTRERPVDVRVIASTHRDLPALVAQGAFREDLFYRLNTCVLRIPALREREGDVDVLVDHFVAARNRAGQSPLRFTDDARAVLRAYRWPGNVRQLRGAVEHAAVVAANGIVTRESLPAELSGDETPSEPAVDLGALTYRDALEQVRADGVKRYLDAILERFGGNVAAAAEHADVERESFYRLCRKHGVNPGAFRGRS